MIFFVIKIYGKDVISEDNLIFSPFSSETPNIIRDEIYCELTFAGKVTELVKMFFPLIFKGGNPLFSIYSISQPKSFKASTKIEIGLCFILFDPVKIFEFSEMDE